MKRYLFNIVLDLCFALTEEKVWITAPNKREAIANLRHQYWGLREASLVRTVKF